MGDKPGVTDVLARPPRCLACGVPIVWAQPGASGHWLALERAPTLYELGPAAHCLRVKLASLYTPHFPRCPGRERLARRLERLTAGRFRARDRRKRL